MNIVAEQWYTRADLVLGGFDPISVQRAGRNGELKLAWHGDTFSVQGEEFSRWLISLASQPPPAATTGRMGVQRLKASIPATPRPATAPAKVQTPAATSATAKNTTAGTPPATKETHMPAQKQAVTEEQVRAREKQIDANLAASYDAAIKAEMARGKSRRDAAREIGKRHPELADAAARHNHLR